MAEVQDFDRLGTNPIEEAVGVASKHQSSNVIPQIHHDRRKFWPNADPGDRFIDVSLKWLNRGGPFRG
jgi:hypothetical protein